MATFPSEVDMACPAHAAFNDPSFNIMSHFIVQAGKCAQQNGQEFATVTRLKIPQDAPAGWVKGEPLTWCKEGESVNMCNAKTQVPGWLNGHWSLKIGKQRYSKCAASQETQEEQRDCCAKRCYLHDDCLGYDWDIVTRDPHTGDTGCFSVCEFVRETTKGMHIKTKSTPVNSHKCIQKKSSQATTQPAATKLTATTVTTAAPAAATTSASSACTTMPGVNAVRGEGRITGPDHSHPAYATAELCADACAADATCAVYTYHSAGRGDAGDEWHLKCVMWSEAEARSVGRLDPSAWQQEGGHVSGLCTKPTPTTPAPPPLSDIATIPTTSARTKPATGTTTDGSATSAEGAATPAGGVAATTDAPPVTATPATSTATTEAATATKAAAGTTAAGDDAPGTTAPATAAKTSGTGGDDGSGGPPTTPAGPLATAAPTAGPAPTPAATATPAAATAGPDPSPATGTGPASSGTSATPTSSLDPFRPETTPVAAPTTEVAEGGSDATSVSTASSAATDAPVSEAPCPLACINGGRCVLARADCSDLTAPFDTPTCDCGTSSVWPRGRGAGRATGNGAWAPLLTFGAVAPAQSNAVGRVLACTGIECC